MSIVIKPVEATIQHNGCKCVVYGGAGVGKTRLALTCPRPLYISAEKGQLSLSGSHMPTFEVTGLPKLIDLRDWCIKSAEARQFDTLIIDSLSEVSEEILRVAKSNTKDGRKAHNDAFELVVADILNSFRDLPQKHIYFICKERWDEDQVTKIKQYKPSMPNGNLIREVPYKCDYLFRYTQIPDPSAPSGVWSGLQCNADATAVAKDRSGKLNKWEPPDLGSIFAKAMR